jgi:CheY-like chemotaxis protein
LPDAHAPKGLIVVIDDEVAILDATRRLLSSWGHKVIAAGDAEAAVAALESAGETPDLILSDYRLSGGLTGIEAIAHLRSVFGEGVPAVLITGDTAPDRLSEAHQRGFLLLHKPLSKGRLRATIGNLLIRNPPTYLDKSAPPADDLIRSAP